MRRFRALGTLVVTLALVVAAPSGASASDTQHGKFVSATGINSGEGVYWQPPAGSENPYDLALAGTWNINKGSKGIQVTGNIMPTTTLPECGTALPPCPFRLTLNMGTAWTETSPGVYESTIDVGVRFDLTFETFADGHVTLTMDITGCPYGWQTWIFEGETVAG